MRVGEFLSYRRPKDPLPPEVEGLPNFWHITATPGQKRAQIEKGIDNIHRITSPDGTRVPAVLLGSSLHKVGSAVTPWQDEIHPDIGYALYYGDSRVTHSQAPDTPGNRTLLDTFRRHSSPDLADRLKAEPLVLFRRKKKGVAEFAGFGIIERITRVTQITSGRPFANYAFELLLFDLRAEGEDFRWDWISARRSSDKTDQECLALAPASWQVWVKRGAAANSSVRRSVAKISIESKEEQLPEPGSDAATTLQQILDFYDGGKKHRFEAVAELIAQSVLGRASGAYDLGWVSPRGHDFGIDFVGRLSLGSGFARTPLVVLGQAKCERSATSGRDIARTVARLQRGWVGCYVTTSYFSDPVQQEVIEDKYPIALIHGRRVAEELNKLALSAGCSPLELLIQIDKSYDDRVAHRRPEEVLLMPSAEPRLPMT
jgi:hypothetical protein